MSNAALLDRINGWCDANGVLRFGPENLSRPDGLGPTIVDFLPEESRANRGFASTMSFKFSSGKGTYIRPMRVNSWKEGIPPAIIDGVLTVVLVRVGVSIFTVVSEQYRQAVGGFQLEPGRGFATDTDWRGEEAEYTDVYFPKSICDPALPADGILGLRAARREATEEIHGTTPFSSMRYCGYINETDSTARMRTSVWLATVDLQNTNELKALEPDSQQRDTKVFSLGQLRQMIGREIRSAQVISAFCYALNVVDAMNARFGKLDKLWEPNFAA